MRILSIETSCDETSIAIAEFSGSKTAPRVRVFSHIVLSQIPVHKKFGGVVPNLARREHERNLIPILMESFHSARLGNSNFQTLSSCLRRQAKQIPNSKILKIKQILEREPELLKQFLKKVVPLQSPPIDAIAVTYGPGLAPALWVGVNFARALSLLWGKPLIPTNHMLGHLYSALLQEQRISKSKFLISKHDKRIQATSYKLQVIKFPALALLVSGGHTELVLMRGHNKFKIVGETLDDAAGEAFDKVARILGLGYPGGPEISKLAGSSLLKSDFNNKGIRLPRPMLNTKDYNFSFSGLKTAVLYLTRDLGAKKTKHLRSVIAKEFQDAVIDVLVKKTVRAAKAYKAKTVLLGGGVSANRSLRQTLEKEIKRFVPDSCFLLPDPSLTGDNALMIATAAHFQWASLAPEGRAAYFSGKKKAPDRVGADANLRLGKN